MDTPLSWTHTRQTIIRPCRGSLTAVYSSSSLILYQMHWSLWTSRAHWSTRSVWSQPISRVSLAFSLSVSLALSLFWVIWNFWIPVPNDPSIVKLGPHNKFQLSTGCKCSMRKSNTQDVDGRILWLLSVQSLWKIKILVLVDTPLVSLEKMRINLFLHSFTLIACELKYFSH